jgi:ketosteroid isomerase-like protein
MKLEEISDRLEIQDLMVEYCYAIDNRDWDALDNVFTPDAIIDYSEMVGVKGTLPEIKEFLAKSMSVVAACQHIITTSQIKIDGDRAQGRTICTNPMALQPDGHVMLLGLWYRDEFVRTDKGWRISSRYEENCWRYNVPPGLLPQS